MGLAVTGCFAQLTSYLRGWVAMGNQRLLWRLAGVSLVILLSGCVAGIPEHNRSGNVVSMELPQLLEQARTRAGHSSETLLLVDQGLADLGNADYAKASSNFNQALKLDTANSWLQFLNGLAYHLGALNGDSSLYELSEQGYLLAIRFDPTNWVARYQLGLLCLDQKKYPAAQEYLAEALLFNESNPDLLYSLVVASYYAKDPATAAGILDRLIILEPESERVLRADCMVRSALGDNAGVKSSLDRYARLFGGKQVPGGLAMRIGDWRRFYEQVGQRSVPEGVGALEIQPAAYQPPVPVKENTDQKTGSDAKVPAVETAEEQPKMIIVDVVMVGTEENVSTRKGVNLLSGLSIQFGATDKPAYGYQETRHQDKDSSVYETSKTITKALSIPAVSYSLNIFNSQSDRAEILARPTLIALDGEESKFFSGLNIQASAVGDSNNGTSGAVQINEKVGVTLGIKPQFLDNKSIKLQVHAQRRFLKTPSPDIVYENKIETTETDVSATVIINFGETLVLSGLSEKETERIRDGVPFLQDIPGLQYLFSKKDTRDYQRSVLILLTPRPPQYVYRETEGNQAQGEKSQQSSLNELKARYSDWFKPYPNWASVFHHMQSNSLYREFRTGDVTLERWEGQQSLSDRLRIAMDFLYY